MEPSLSIVLSNMGFSGFLMENLSLVIIAINNISVPVLVVPLGKEPKIGIYHSAF